MKRALIPLAAAVLTIGATGGTAGAARAPEPDGAVAACPYTAFCIWPKPNYQGSRHVLYGCAEYVARMTGPISYSNDQENGTKARFRTSAGLIVTPGAPDSDPSFGAGLQIYGVQTCVT